MRIDNRTPRIRFIKLYGEGLDTVEAHDVVFADIGDTPVTLEQVMALKEKYLEWRCWTTGCGRRIRFGLCQIDSVPFWIARHFLQEHRLTPEQVLDMVPFLDREVLDCSEAMGRERPVVNQTGVPTQMGTTEVKT